MKPHIPNISFVIWFHGKIMYNPIVEDGFEINLCWQ